MNEKFEKYLDEIEVKINNASPEELREIAENMEYEVLQRMSTKVQGMIFNALK